MKGDTRLLLHHRDWKKDIDSVFYFSSLNNVCRRHFAGSCTDAESPKIAESYQATRGSATTHHWQELVL